MQSRFFSLDISPINTKIIVYGNLTLPVDYDLLKRNSDYFRKNDLKYSSEKNIHLLKEERNKISEDSIRDFIQCCQTQQIELNSSNIFSLNYLAKKYEVYKLLAATTQYISDYKEKLAIDSILFNYHLYNSHNQFCLVDTKEEEDIISCNFEEFIKDKRLIDLPLPVLYRIIQRYSNQKPNTNENQEMQDSFVSLLFTLLKKHGRKASYLFSFLKIDKSRLKDLIELKTGFSDVFDPTFLNSSLFDTTVEIIQEANNLRNDFSMKIDELKNIIEKQKNEKEEIEEKITKQNQMLLDEIHKMRDEMSEMKNQLKFFKKNDIISLDLIDSNQIQYLIPYSKDWDGNPKSICLKEKGQEYKIESSTSAGKGHELMNLFSGVKSTEGDICWRNKYLDNPPYIQITFPKPEKANALLLTSRIIYFDEAPTVFEIYGMNLPSNAEICLGKFSYYEWKSYETKVFLFHNESAYKTYKLMFIRSKSEYSVVGLSQLNLCYLAQT